MYDVYDMKGAYNTLLIRNVESPIGEWAESQNWVQELFKNLGVFVNNSNLITKCCADNVMWRLRNFLTLFCD